MNNLELIQKLEKRKGKLEEIACSTYHYNDPKLEELHNKKVNDAKFYMREIEELVPILGSTTKKIFIVPSSTTFEKRVDKADYATIEDEGLFFRLALINNFPTDDFLILYLVPLTSL